MQSISGNIDDFKIKASYGQSARAPSHTGLFFSNYETSDWEYLDNKGVYSTSMQLVNMGWERFITRNIGTTLEMFKHRLFLDFEITGTQPTICLMKK
jgi:outer membrane cobalamin receptor